MSTDPLVTLTLNPTLDVSWSADVVGPTHKVRVEPERSEPGGGGVNVSRVCHRMSQPTVAVVALGGLIGQQVADLLKAADLPFRPVPIAGDTRQSVTVLEGSTGAQYRFVLPGPAVAQAELDTARKTVVAEAGDKGWVVVSGSMPPGVDPSFLTDLASAVGGHRMIVDTSGPALAAAFNASVFLVKPSVRELAAVVGRELETEADVIQAADEVVADGTMEVLVASIGAGGAYLACRDGSRYRLRAPSVRVRSAVGAGDSMVAGLAMALQQGASIAEAARRATAAGSAAVMTAGTELCLPADVDRLLDLVGLEELA